MGAFGSAVRIATAKRPWWGLDNWLDCFSVASVGFGVYGAARSVVASSVGPRLATPSVVERGPAISAPTNRSNLRSAMGDPPFAGAEAHHGLPWKNREWFAEKGMNVNDPKYGAWVRGGGNGGHQSWSKQYGNVWDDYILDNPSATKNQIENYYNSIRSDPKWDGGF